MELLPYECKVWQNNAEAQGHRCVRRCRQLNLDNQCTSEPVHLDKRHDVEVPEAVMVIEV